MVDQRHRKQGGAILIIVGLALAVLLGMAGLVIDLGTLFVTKTELQSAMDSCALAAVKELDGQAGALDRARSAGISAGNAHSVGYQKAQVSIAKSDVTFSEKMPIDPGSGSDTNARYARCSHTINGITAYLIKLIGGPSSGAVNAVAVATLDPTQTPCTIPLGLISKGPNAHTPGSSYGYTSGEWVKLRYANKQGEAIEPVAGEMGWFNGDTSQSASETKNEMANGYCGDSFGKILRTPGNKLSVDDAWNSRFGIYKSYSAMSVSPPDYTGYAYTSVNWPSKSNAYSNYQEKRNQYKNYADGGDGIDDGDLITGLQIDKTKGYDYLASDSIHESNGKPLRRLALVPVLSASTAPQKHQVIDYACMLLLHPVAPSSSVEEPSAEEKTKGKSVDESKDAWLEFVSNASSPGSPCGASGFSGGVAGPLVPTLVE